MILFWTGVLALSVLLYVLMDGFDLGVDCAAPARVSSGSVRGARGVGRRLDEGSDLVGM
jgi:hypothetical protein